MIDAAQAYEALQLLRDIRDELRAIKASVAGMRADAQLHAGATEECVSLTREVHREVCPASDNPYAFPVNGGNGHHR